MTCCGNQVEYHITKNCLEYHQDADHVIIINQRRSVLVIVHTLIGVSVCWKVQIRPDIESDSTDGEIRFVYKAVKKAKVIRRYM